MTSLYEGLPMVGLEAQASRKKVVLSNTISSDTKLTPNVTFVELDETKERWSNVILSQPWVNEVTTELLEYDVSHTLQQMLKVYKIYQGSKVCLSI
ncbi:hypothetical protein LOS19_04560 [Enterococcus faecium]|nr:hypothetical protein [Enterococcus faecium]